MVPTHHAKGDLVLQWVIYSGKVISRHKPDVFDRQKIGWLAEPALQFLLEVSFEHCMDDWACIVLLE
ncbi:hypothetical protein TNCV_1976371 [Trichonephila clavipes]|nr:hypothetical protein TNCV_1976371 [Trichonephila clavipes]